MNQTWPDGSAITAQAKAMQRVADASPGAPTSRALPRANPLVIAAAAALAIVTLAPLLGVYNDWGSIFAPAGRMVLAGKNPWDPSTGFVSPPWVLALVVPLGLLPDPVSGTLVRLAIIAALIVLGRRLGGTTSTIAVLLTSLPAVNTIFHGNVDAFTALGVLIDSGPLALMLCLTKPQVGAAAFAIRALESRNVVCAGVVLGIAAFTVLNVGHRVMAAEWNHSLFPWSVPVGMGLTLWALRCRQAGDPRWRNYVLLAGPLLSPYAAAGNWSGAMVGLLPWPKVLVAAWAAFWIGRAFIWGAP